MNVTFEQLLAEAAEWRIQLEEQSLNAVDSHAFNQWLHESSQHAKAWQEINTTWDSLSVAEGPTVRTTLEKNHKQEKQKIRKILSGSLTTFVFLLILPLAWLQSTGTSVSHWLADFHTTKGDRVTFKLEDGSQISLNTATAIDLNYTSDKREIILRKGELFIDVAHDSSRPLEIVTDVGHVQALGTRFSVRWSEADKGQADEMHVSVYESRVQVCTNERQKCQNLNEGYQISASEHQLSETASLTSYNQPAWLLGQLNVLDMPVAEVLQALQRYHKGVLHFDSEELSDLRVSGTLPLDDIPRALDAIALSVPINVESYTDWIFVVNYKKEQ